MSTILKRSCNKKGSYESSPLFLFSVLCCTISPNILYICTKLYKKRFTLHYPSQLKQSGSIALAAISPRNTDSVLI